MNMDTYEKDLNRELDEMLAMLKTLENKLISEPNVTIRDVIDIYAIHLAVLRDIPEHIQAKGECNDR